MISATFIPLSNFTGFISHIQGKVDDYITCNSSSVWLNHTQNYPEVAFKYDLTDFPAATNTTDEEKWISFSLINAYFYITHYELKQRVRTVADFLSKWNFEASYDKQNWITLDTSSADEEFDKLGAHKLFPCKSGIFQHFRLHELK